MGSQRIRIRHDWACLQCTTKTGGDNKMTFPYRFSLLAFRFPPLVIFDFMHMTSEEMLECCLHLHLLTGLSPSPHGYHSKMTQFIGSKQVESTAHPRPISIDWLPPPLQLTSDPAGKPENLLNIIFLMRLFTLHTKWDHDYVINSPLALSWKSQPLQPLTPNLLNDKKPIAAHRLHILRLSRMKESW